MATWTFVSRDPEDTRAIGRALGRSIGADGLVIALVGPLGAGKTLFVKGLAEGLGVDPRSVSSPTFVIAQQYPVPAAAPCDVEEDEVGSLDRGTAEAETGGAPGRGGPELLHHVDLYRLESEDELETIGFDDMLAPGSVLAVEWADRFPEALGRDHLRVELEGPRVAAEGDATPRPRTGRVSILGRPESAAAIIAQDWLARLERRTSGAGDADRIVETRAWTAGLLALGLLASAVGSFGPLAAPRACAAYRPVAEDALGTLRVRCREVGDGAGGVAAPNEPGAIRGIGRWLVGARVDVATADARLLEALPGVGPARAAALLEARAAAPFARIEDLERARGIGPATRAALARWLEVSSSTPRIDPSAPRAGGVGRRDSGRRGATEASRRPSHG